jgi:DNA modification methylase
MIAVGDATAILRTVPDGVIQTCVTSPPYWGLRDYGVDGLNPEYAEMASGRVGALNGLSTWTGEGGEPEWMRDYE